MSVVDLQSRKDAKPRRKRLPRTPDRWERDLLTDLDWRTREGKFLTAARKRLVAHVGGNPTNARGTETT
jgi:hypothetical protein